MATIKKLPRKKGESYQICFTHPVTKKTVRKVFRGSQIDAIKVKKQIEADIAFGKFNIDNNSNIKIEKIKYIIFKRENNIYQTFWNIDWVFRCTIFNF